MTIVYAQRWEFMEPHLRGKTVLDIGPAELVGTVNCDKRDTWLHARIKAVAACTVGLEKSVEQVDALKKLGYEVLVGDAESFALDQAFDIVNAGELIEHLSNPGLFLECAKEHLRPGGVLLLSTPNRFSAAQFFWAFLGNTIPAYEKPIAKHVAFYDEMSLRDLLVRHGFSQITIGYCQWVGRPNHRLSSRLLNALIRQFRPKFLGTLVVAATR